MVGFGTVSGIFFLAGAAKIMKDDLSGNVHAEAGASFSYKPVKKPFFKSLMDYMNGK